MLLKEWTLNLITATAAAAAQMLRAADGRSDSWHSADHAALRQRCLNIHSQGLSTGSRNQERLVRLPFRRQVLTGKTRPVHLALR